MTDKRPPESTRAGGPGKWWVGRTGSPQGSGPRQAWPAYESHGPPTHPPYDFPGAHIAVLHFLGACTDVLRSSLRRRFETAGISSRLIRLSVDRQAITRIDKGGRTRKMVGWTHGKPARKWAPTGLACVRKSRLPDPPTISPEPISPFCISSEPAPTFCEVLFAGVLKRQAFL